MRIIKMRKLVIVTILSMVLTVNSTAFADENLEQTNKLNKAEITTANYLLENITDPTISSVGGEWAIIGLSRSNLNIPKAFYEKYYNNVVLKLKESGGNLTSTKYTEYSRIILALTSIGKDVTDVGGYNLLEKLADFDNVKKQGINGLIYALIALDSKQYEIPIVSGVKTQTTRQLLIDNILKEEITCNKVVGGFSLGGKSPDPDITGMALQSLSVYKNQEEVSNAIERGLNVLENMDIEESGSESIAQVILGKAAVGADCNDEIQVLMKYYVDEGGFKHVLDGELDLMASEQGLYALVVYERYFNGDNHLYDMTDKVEVEAEAEVKENIFINENKDYIFYNQNFLLKLLTRTFLLRSQVNK